MYNVVHNNVACLLSQCMCFYFPSTLTLWHCCLNQSLMCVSTLYWGKDIIL